MNQKRTSKTKERFGVKNRIMIRNLKELTRNKLIASNGEVGTLEDFYFDSRNWFIRYLVVDTGSWLNRRRLLFSPFAVRLPGINDEQKDIYLDLQKESIEKSPPIDPKRTLTRQQEIELNQYYDWPFYWVRVDHSSYPLVEMYTEMKEETGRGMSDEEPQLQSLENIKKYSIEARDGSFGSIDDFLIDDESWRIQYVVVDIGGLLPGKRTLVAPHWFEEMDNLNSHARVDLSVSTIHNSPLYDPDTPIDQEYEERLESYHHQGKKQ
jgi:hypothetical protein